MDAAPCHFVSFSFSYPIIQCARARTSVEYVRYVYIYTYINREDLSFLCIFSDLRALDVAQEIKYPSR